MTEKIIGLHASLFDDDSGAPITHFVIAQYTIRTLNSPGSQTVFQGYVSQSAFQAGKRPLTSRVIDVPQVPAGGDVVQWLYELAPTIEGTDLYGAVPVTASA
ncbi:MAG: hypothetical protein ACN6OS_09595 [Comamonas testosteroni]|uniref:hypothetical protein n=1 Tax=Comamonas testosteroni TaxID=285 RepID=UPI003D0EF019